VWREGRVGAGCEFRVFFDETRANFGTIDHGAPPQARMPLPQLGSHPLQEVRKSNGRPLRTPPFCLVYGTPYENLTPLHV
jgi:hypothetical protein